MFDGTDLSLAYGSSYDAPQMPMNTQQQLPPPAITTEPVVSKGSMSHAMPPEPVYAPPPAMYAQQSAAPPASMMPPSESFWERMAGKKWEIIKLVVLALVIVLGISIDRVATHYMTTYIGQAFLTSTQEFLVRLGYPVLVILVLWIVKTMA